MQWDRRDLLIKNAALPSHSYEEMSQAEWKVTVEEMLAGFLCAV